MSDEPEPIETPAPPAEPTGEGSTDARIARIESTLGELISFIRGGGPPRAEPEAEVPDIKAEVRAAVREVQKADKDKAAKDGEAQSIKDQIGELKAAIEQQPEEFRRVTQAMGWNRP